MEETIGPRNEWLCFKNIRERMKTLKDAADKEINSKIDIVCRTRPESKNILKYPFKAEGLKGMWARYSSELESRMENRINQLIGSNGGQDFGCAEMVEEFLTSTYPQIIAMMVTYKCVFEQIKVEYANNMITRATVDNRKIIQQISEENLDCNLRNNITAWSRAK